MSVGALFLEMGATRYGSAMAIAVDTATVEPGERFEMWHEAAGRCFFPLDIRRRGEGPFSGRIVRHDLVPVEAFRVVADPNLCTRTPAGVAARDPEHLQIHLLRRGRCVVRQGDRDDVLTPGTMTTLDSSRDYALDAREPFELLVFSVPRTLLGSDGDALRRATARTIDGRSGLGALIVPFLDGLVGRLEDGSVAAGRAQLAETLLALLRALAQDGAGGPGVAPSGLLLTRIRAYVERNLGDPGLTPPAIAAAHFISTRYLHKLYEAEGQTVAGSIRRARLERCRRDLADPASATQTITDIAARWGMPDPAHFSRLFRAAYGCSPRELRARARQDCGASSRAP